MKTIEDHTTLFENWLGKLPVGTHAPLNRNRVDQLLQELSVTTCRDVRRRRLARLRDAIHLLYGVPQFASITAYERWLEPEENPKEL